MTKKDIIYVEKLLTIINELSILTNNQTAQYFYDNFEMVALCTLVNEVDDILLKISSKLKIKYSNIKWDIISNYRDNIDGLITVGSIWTLSSKALSSELGNDLKKLLAKELPLYYKNYCNKKAKNFKQEIRYE